MTKVTIERPGQTTFGKLQKGRIFEARGQVYVKGQGLTATAIIKSQVLMNGGDSEILHEDLVVQRVTEISFKVG